MYLGYERLYLFHYGHFFTQTGVASLINPKALSPLGYTLPQTSDITQSRTHHFVTLVDTFKRPLPAYPHHRRTYFFNPNITSLLTGDSSSTSTPPKEVTLRLYIP